MQRVLRWVKQDVSCRGGVKSNSFKAGWHKKPSAGTAVAAFSWHHELSSSKARLSCYLLHGVEAPLMSFYLSGLVALCLSPTSVFEINSLALTSCVYCRNPTFLFDGISLCVLWKSVYKHSLWYAMVTLPESKTTLSLFSYYIISICKYLNDSEIIWPESSSLCSCVFANSPHKAWHTKTTSSVQEHWYLRTEKLLEVLCSLLGEQQCWDVISLENCSKLLPPSRTSVTAHTNACFPVLCRQWELPSTAVFCQLRAVTKLIWGLPHIKAALYLLTLWVSLKIGEVSNLPSCLLLGIIEASVFCTMIFSFFFFF